MSHEPTPQPVPETHKTPEKNSFMSQVPFFVTVIAIVLFVRTFIAEPFIVSGASMEETFQNNQYLIVDRVSYRFSEPDRNDVIIFRYPLDESQFFIKRIIGLPGETVTIDGSEVHISSDDDPEGFILSQPYVKSMLNGSDSSTTLDENEYFVMGDNRDHSSDSRVWGAVPEDDIVGRAFLRLLPISEADILPGDYPVTKL